ncbi:MAG: hypothetical protein ACI4PO_01915 [Faecousia sp.]
MKKISIFVLILVLTVSTLSGCRRRNEGGTSSPSAGTTTATQTTTGTTVPATTDSHRETQDNGIIDDIITEGSDIIDDVLPDGTTHTDSATNGNDNSDNVRSRGVPRY